jgi:hypothetical protein
MLEFQEIHVLDKNAEALGVPTSDLMENAGRGVAEFITGTLIESGSTASDHPGIVIFWLPGISRVSVTLRSSWLRARIISGRSLQERIMRISPRM